MPRHIKRPKHQKRRCHIPQRNPFKATDALLYSGASVLIAMALGASPDKAMEYGIQCLKFCGAKVELIPDNAPDAAPDHFMVGLA